MDGECRDRTDHLLEDPDNTQDQNEEKIKGWAGVKALMLYFSFLFYSSFIYFSVHQGFW